MLYLLRCFFFLEDVQYLSQFDFARVQGWRVGSVSCTGTQYTEL